MSSREILFFLDIKPCHFLVASRYLEETFCLYFQRAKIRRGAKIEFVSQIFTVRSFDPPASDYPVVLRHALKNGIFEHFALKTSRFICLFILIYYHSVLRIL